METVRETGRRAQEGGPICRMGKELAYCLYSIPSCGFEVERVVPHMRLGSCATDLGIFVRRDRWCFMMLIGEYE